MNHYKACTLLFLVALLIGSGIANIVNANPEIEALLDEIAALESERDRLTDYEGQVALSDGQNGNVHG